MKFSLILITGNDLAKSEVFDELNQYNQNYYNPSWISYPRYYGGQSGFDDFNVSITRLQDRS